MNSTSPQFLIQATAHYQARLTQNNIVQGLISHLGLTDPDLLKDLQLGYSNGTLPKELTDTLEKDLIKSLAAFIHHLVIPILKKNEIINLEFVSLEDLSVTRLFPSSGTYRFTHILKTYSGISVDEAKEKCWHYWQAHKKNGLAVADSGVATQSDNLSDQVPSKKPRKSEPPLSLSNTYQLKHIELRGGKMLVTIKVVSLTNLNKFVLDTVNLYSKSQRAEFVLDVARLLGKPKSVVESEVLALLREIEERGDSLLDSRSASGSGTGVAVSGMSGYTESLIPARHKKEALEFLRDDQIFECLIEDFNRLGMVGEDQNKILGYLAMTSRKLESPVSIAFLSPLASGKSMLQSCLHQLCPPEDRLHFTRLTPQSLYYLGSDALKHKFLSIEEDIGLDEVAYSIKILLSAKSLSLASTYQDAASGHKKTCNKVVEGPVSVVMSTTKSEMEPELASRILVINADESFSQTELILDSQRVNRTLKGKLSSEKYDTIIAKHYAIQRLLDAELVVVNNLAPSLKFPTDQLKFRRGHAHYLNLIEAIAFLRQFQKEVRRHKRIGRYIEVDSVDIEWANRLFEPILKNWNSGLKPATQKLLGQIRKLCLDSHSRVFLRREIREKFKWDAAHLHRHLRELIHLDYVRPKVSINGLAHTYELMDESFSVGTVDSVDTPLSEA